MELFASEERCCRSIEVRITLKKEGIRVSTSKGAVGQQQEHEAGLVVGTWRL